MDHLATFMQISNQYLQDYAMSYYQKWVTIYTLTWRVLLNHVLSRVTVVSRVAKESRMHDYLQVPWVIYMNKQP